MDTDDLSAEVYRAIIVEAERFNHDLTRQFGLLSYDCDDESEYLDRSILLAQSIKEFDVPEISNIFFGKTPDRALLDRALGRILKNIEKVKEIPVNKRHYEL